MMHGAKLGDVVASMKNGIYKPASEYGDDGVPCLRMYNIDAGSIVWRDIKRMRVSDSELEEYGLREGDLLVNRVNSRELVGKTACIPPSMGPSVFESKNIRVRLDQAKALPKFINYQLFARGRHFFAGNAQQVVGMASISQKQLADFPIVLAGLDEQRYIVAEIEKQFSRLDEAVANLKRVKANLKRYKAAALKAAVEGRLVETESVLARREGRSFETGAQLLQRILETRRSQWQGRGKYKEPAAPDTTDLPELPAGWMWLALNQFALLENGDRSKNYPSRSEFVDEGVPFINAGHLKDGRIDMPEMNFISEERFALLRAGKVREDDLLFCLRGSLGKVAIVSGIDSGAIASSLVIVRPAADVIPAYLLCYFMSPLAHDQIQLYDNGSAQPNLSAADLGKFVVPIPPVATQRQIVSEVDRLFSILRETEAQVDANLQRAECLRQSILQRAFTK